MSTGNPLKWFYHHFGLASIHATGRDAYLVILMRTLRMLAYGLVALILALFFAELGFPDSRIGLFMTLTLLGDVVLGLFLTLIADRIGRRRVLFAGSVLMVLTGAVFAVSKNFWVLLGAAVVGVVSATGGDFGPFRAIEESIVSQLTNSETRADVLSWYVTFSAWGSGVGMELSGRSVEKLRGLDGWTLLDAYRSLFWVYSIMGLVNATLVLLLTKACEAGSATEKSYSQVAQDDGHADTDSGIEMEDNFESSSPTAVHSPQGPTERLRRWLSNWLAGISAPTRAVMYKLWTLLALDSIADGMVPYSLTAYYMDTKFHPTKATLGDVTSISMFLAAMSGIFAGPLSRGIGLINTMVFTHIPSSAAVLLFPLPSALWLTVLLLFVRTGLNNMDQAPRAAFIAAVVQPSERTAVMGITGMLRTLAAAAGPTMTGVLAGTDRFWVAFVAAGACRLVYDVGLYAMFINMKLHAHEGGLPSRSGPGDEEIAMAAELGEFEILDDEDEELGNDDDDDHDNDDDDDDGHGSKVR